MKCRKYTIILLTVLTTAILSASASYAQSWGEILLGVGSALLENHIDNSNRYSSQDKESMRNSINTINNSINVNQNARNATRDAYNGNYTGAVIQGTQTIMNATGNHSYDTYLNSANQINNANRQYNQDIQNGMDRNEALEKRNTTIGYSAAESVIELQDKIAQERLEKARQQREAERQSWENNYNYETPSYNETNTRTSSYNTDNANVTSGVTKPSWQTTSDYSSKKESDHYKNIEKNKSFNSNAKTLSPTNAVVFNTDDGKHVFLSIPFHYYGEDYFLSYNNQSSKTIRLCCNRASVKAKYYGDDMEKTYTGACSFIMPAHSDSKIALSAMFPNLSNTSSIESIKVLFVDTQITDEIEINEKKNRDANNNVRYDSNSNTHLLTKNRIVKLNTDEGTIVALGIDNESGRLFYNNLYNNKDIKFTCDRVSIKIKYFGEEKEHNYTDVCTFVMHANTYDYLEWSDVFFNISGTQQIENIKVQFVDIQIR